ncbi:protease SohB [Microbulbifer sp. THAF38]|uniref:protease SohB n=1 Tax=Microbulbifer sp. THAF38 TaxID=2587856 RepID=UPI001267B7AD|nr:protease SohB [Microbulbifer sp. THAF38]QFT55462.1 putative protease SohB [Microbulbifer sp. THAF38]
MEFLIEYGLFLAKIVTVIVALMVLVGFIFANREQLKERVQGHISVTRLNDRYEQFKETLLEALMEKHEFNQRKKQLAKEKKAEEKALVKRHKAAAKEKASKGGSVAETKEPQTDTASEAPEKAADSMGERKRIFVTHFNGDIKASGLSHLREEITAILQVAEAGDEVLLCLESPGGMVANYGLAASQLARVRSAGIQLTIAVDKVAASGGYMMACVADRILAAPFAMLGSIGVLAQLPNFNRLLKRHDVDYELFTAGEFKRTVTMFGENTEEGREKFQSDLEEIHVLFQHFISEYRPKLDVAKVATGEVWFGQKALAMGLVDELKTSDEYLTDCAKHADLFQVEYKEKKNIAKKMGLAAEAGVESALTRLFSKLTAWRHHAQ